MFMDLLVLLKNLLLLEGTFYPGKFTVPVEHAIQKSYYYLLKIGKEKHIKIF